MWRVLAAWVLPCLALASEANLSWVAPTQRVDGSAYTNPGGYRLFERCGSDSLALLATVGPTENSYQRTGIQDNGQTCFWSLLAFDLDGIESARTNEVSKAFPASLPGQATNLVITWAGSQGAPEMATYFTDFGSETNGALGSSADWTSTLAGTWAHTVQTDAGATGGKSVALTDGGWGDSFTIDRNDAIVGTGTTGDIELVAKFKVATVSAWGSDEAIGPALSNQADADDFYALIRSGANVGLQYAQDNSPWESIGSAVAPGFTITNDTYLWVRIGRSGTTIRAKIWADGSGEPGSWMISGTHTTLSSVRAAFVVNEADSGPCTWDVFGVGTDGDAAPTSSGGGGAVSLPPVNQPSRSFAALLHH